MWRRSQLTPKADGTLVCPDDVKGRDIITLNDGNARAAASLGPTGRVYAGGTYPRDDTSDVVDVATVVGTVTFGNGSGH